jgi:Ca2+-binding RTX toxin-like protein
MATTRAVLLLATMGAALALFCGAALAATVRCEKSIATEDEGCRGTDRADTLIGNGEYYDPEPVPGQGGVIPVRERFFGSGGDDTIKGRGGPDFLYGQKGDDTLIGGKNYVDRLIGGPGDDRLEWGEGYDHYVFSGRWGDDTVYRLKGAALREDSLSSLDFDGYLEHYGEDRTVLPEVTADLRIDLTPGRGPEVTDGTNTVELAARGGLIDVVYSGSGDDAIQARNANNVNQLYGGAGHDILSADDGGRDSIGCGEGIDEVYFDYGVDDLSGGCEVLRPR